jgi:asparagine synthetase B (glutamine-hydrolysing)
MCGIFGYVGPSPDKALLRELAVLADERGGHGFGAHIAYPNGELTMRGMGRAETYIDSVLSAIHGKTSFVFGQSRLASSNIWEKNTLQNIQPIRIRGHVLVHNGNIDEYKELYRKYFYNPSTRIDSEAIIMTYLTSGLQALKALMRGRPHAYVLITPEGKLEFSRYKLPLFFRQDPNDQFYFCSKPFTRSKSLTEHED